VQVLKQLEARKAELMKGISDADLDGRTQEVKGNGPHTEANGATAATDDGAGGCGPHQKVPVEPSAKKPADKSKLQGAVSTKPPDSVRKQKVLALL
jgi:hypothetical protein